MIYVLSFILLSGVLYFVLQPLFDRTYRPAFIQDALLRAAPNDLQHMKKEFLYALKDLEFEYQTGKISVTDYEDLKRHYEKSAIEVMRELEASDNGTLSDKVEREIEKHRATLHKPDQVHYCSQCGALLARDAKYCSQCGRSLQTQ